MLRSWASISKYFYALLEAKKNAGVISEGTIIVFQCLKEVPRPSDSEGSHSLSSVQRHKVIEVISRTEKGIPKKVLTRRIGNIKLRPSREILDLEELEERSVLKRDPTTFRPFPTEYKVLLEPDHLRTSNCWGDLMRKLSVSIHNSQCDKERNVREKLSK